MKNTTKDGDKKSVGKEHPLGVLHIFLEERKMSDEGNVGAKGTGKGKPKADAIANENLGKDFTAANAAILTADAEAQKELFIKHEVVLKMAGKKHRKMLSVGLCGPVLLRGWADERPLVAYARAGRDVVLGGVAAKAVWDIGKFGLQFIRG